MLTCSSVRALLKRGVAAGKSEKLGNVEKASRVFKVVAGATWGTGSWKG